MMMIHDLAEARAGDITPHDGVPKEVKAQLEWEAAEYLENLSGNREFLDMFAEYEEKRTLRARLCHDADQLECLMQALEYARIYPDKRTALEDFWPYAEARITTEPGRRIFSELSAQKNVPGPSFNLKPSAPRPV